MFYNDFNTSTRVEMSSSMLHKFLDTLSIENNLLAQASKTTQDKTLHH